MKLRFHLPNFVRLSLSASLQKSHPAAHCWVSAAIAQGPKALSELYLPYSQDRRCQLQMSSGPLDPKWQQFFVVQGDPGDFFRGSFWSREPLWQDFLLLLNEFTFSQV